MHISIPDTSAAYEDPVLRTNPYTLYNIHCNGTYHCSVRYSKLRDLHMELKAAHPELCAKFPPRKALSLTESQTEARRIALQEYLQEVTQDIRISRGPIIVKFFEQAQADEHDPCLETQIDVYLINGRHITVECTTHDSTDDLLELACKQIGVQQPHTYYFGLFLVKDEGQEPPPTIRKLQTFERPYLTLMRLRDHAYKIQIRRSFFTTALDNDLLDDHKALNILFLEATKTVQWDLIPIKSDVRERLQQLQSSGSKQQYIELCRTSCPGYGCSIFRRVDTNKFGKNVTVAVGDNTIKIWPSDQRLRNLPMNRLASWNVRGSLDTGFHFTFTFKLSPTRTEIVTFDLEEGVFMSMCIIDMIDELIRTKRAERIRRPSDRRGLRRKPHGTTSNPAHVDFNAEETQAQEQMAAMAVAQHQDHAADTASVGQESIDSDVPSSEFSSRAASRQQSVPSTPMDPSPASSPRRKSSTGNSSSGAGGGFRLPGRRGSRGSSSSKKSSSKQDQTDPDAAASLPQLLNPAFEHVEEGEVFNDIGDEDL